MRGYAEVVAELRAKQQRESEESNRRFVLFALESVAGDGFPRVSRYSVDHLLKRGLIERDGDRYRLTHEGRILLNTNPAPEDHQLDMFGGEA